MVHTFILVECYGAPVLLFIIDDYYGVPRLCFTWGQMSYWAAQLLLI